MIDPTTTALVAVATAQTAYIFAGWKSRQVDVNEVAKFHRAEASEDALSNMTEGGE